MKHRLQGFSKGLSKNFCSRFPYTASAEVELLLRAMLCSPARGVGAGCGAWSTSWTATRNRCGRRHLRCLECQLEYHQQKVCPGHRHDLCCYRPCVDHRFTLTFSELNCCMAGHTGLQRSSRCGAGIWHAHSILVQFGMQKSSPGANFLIGMKARPSTCPFLNVFDKQ